MMVMSFICELTIVKEENLADSISHAIVTSYQDIKARVQFRAAQRLYKRSNREIVALVLERYNERQTSMSFARGDFFRINSAIFVLSACDVNFILIGFGSPAVFVVFN